MTPRVPSEPDEERRQVEAGDALERAAPGAQQAAVGEHDVEAEDGLAGDAVLDAAHAAGVGGDVAAERGDGCTGRVGGVEQAVLARGRSRSAVITPGSTIATRRAGRVEDAVHPAEVEDDAAAVATAPPATPVPAPRGTTATRCSWATRVVWTSRPTRPGPAPPPGARTRARPSGRSGARQRPRVGGRAGHEPSRAVTTEDGGRVADDDGQVRAELEALEEEHDRGGDRAVGDVVEDVVAAALDDPGLGRG